MIIQEPKVILDEMLTVATLVFYNWNHVTEAKVQEKEQKKEAQNIQIV